MNVRLLSRDGASFALVPVPDLMAATEFGTKSSLLVDIEMLSPDRLVRYLARSVSGRFLSALADAYMAGAHEQYPEQSVPTVADEASGVALSVLDSTPFGVTIEVLVKPDLDADIVEPDGLTFDISRAALVMAAHEIRELVAAHLNGKETS